MVLATGCPLASVVLKHMIALPTKFGGEKSWETKDDPGCKQYVCTFERHDASIIAA